MQLGNFSVSLAVKDIAASRAFYEKLGFRVFGGDQAQNWLILQNETSTIGLAAPSRPLTMSASFSGHSRAAASRWRRRLTRQRPDPPA